MRCPPVPWRKLACALLLLIALLTVAGCLHSPYTPSPTPSAPLAEEPLLTPPSASISTATLGPPTPTTPPTATAPPLQPGEPTLTPAPASVVNGLIVDDARGLFWADPVSGELLPLLAEALGATWARHGAQLALLRGNKVEIVTLTTGQVAMLATDMPIALAEAQLFWGQADSLLLAGWLEPDPNADEPQPELLLQVLRLGGASSPAIAYQGPPAMLLGYDSARQQALLWRPDGEQLLVLGVDLATGQTEELEALDALSELTLGPEGALAALALGATGYQLLITALDATEPPITIPLEPGGFATQLTWSPDGQRLAYAWHRGELYDPEAAFAGLYVYDLASGQVSDPLATAWQKASIAGWAADGHDLIMRAAGSDGPSFAVIDPESASERLLPLQGALQLLGWLPRPDWPPDAPALDAWRGRFATAVGDAQATANAAASFLAGNPDLSLDERTARLNDYFAAAGWPNRDWRIIALGDEMLALEAPPSSIVMAALGQAQIIAQGQTLLDARRVDEQLAVIYGNTYSGAQQWSVALLQLDLGQWQTVWQPLGRNDWVTTDGAVAFVGEGLATLQVSGSSRGLPADAWVECETCPLRQLSAIWRLENAAYVRVSNLPPDAPLADVHWEMTARDTYAVLYEAIRRLRAGQELGTLATPVAATQLGQLELGGDELRLMVAEMTADSVLFGPAAMPTRYRATVRAGQVVAVEVRP